jgi:hypothetical protein
MLSMFNQLSPALFVLQELDQHVRGHNKREVNIVVLAPVSGK